MPLRLHRIGTLTLNSTTSFINTTTRFNLKRSLPSAAFRMSLEYTQERAQELVDNLADVRASMVQTLQSKGSAAQE
ncbi:hypothetical protein BGX27_005042, partial [Mortierella sp. AM989]